MVSSRKGGKNFILTCSSEDYHLLSGFHVGNSEPVPILEIGRHHGNQLLYPLKTDFFFPRHLNSFSAFLFVAVLTTIADHLEVCLLLRCQRPSICCSLLRSVLL